jgi:hypothetical protein
LVAVSPQGNRCYRSRELSNTELLEHYLRLLSTVTGVWREREIISRGAFSKFNRVINYNY